MPAKTSGTGANIVGDTFLEVALDSSHLVDDVRKAKHRRFTCSSIGQAVLGGPRIEKCYL